MKAILSLLTIFVLVIGGCSDNSTSTSNESNTVNVWNTNDSLGISISTTNHTYNDTIQLAFSVDTVNFYISVSGYGGGSGSFKVLRDTALVINKDLGTNYSGSQRLNTGIPTKAIINLASYKGNASILLTK
jgi:hypothetical protein